MTGKILFTKSGKRKQYRSPEAILRRNDQERARQKEMNEAFDALRKVIPNGEWKGKKKSKCETLQGAIEHIENLLELLATPGPTVYDQNCANYYSSPTSSLDQSGYSYGSSGYGSPNSSLTQDQNCFPQIPHLQTSSPEYQYFEQYPDLSNALSCFPFIPTEEDTPLPPLVSSSSARYSPY